MTTIPPGPLRTQRGYVVLGGKFNTMCNDWAITTLAPEIDADHFELALAMILGRLQAIGLEV